MKNTLASLLLSLIPLLAFSNAAQPGLWSAGGTGTFSFLYPEDSTAFQQIQMQKEQVSIQLYDGFAVVKGEYWMYNTSSETIEMHAGYPLNGSYDAGSHMERSDIIFDRLYTIKVLIDNQEVEIMNRPNEEHQPRMDNDNWYVWKNTFPAQTTTKIDVYFIVNTSRAMLSEGYDRNKVNGFIYVLETGASWKPPIGEGKVWMQLMEEFKEEDIRGASPDSIFSWNADKRILSYQFTDLRPTSKDNLIITYEKKKDSAAFSSIIQDSKQYFHTIDQLAQVASNTQYKPIKLGNPFFVQQTGSNTLVGALFMAIIYGPYILLIVAIIAVIMIIRKVRKTISSIDIRP